MRKSLFILATMLLPMTLCAQSALQQLEQMAGMSIHDVHVPDPGDPVPVDPDPEEDSQPQQSTHLKDYTPAQETTQPAPKPEPQTDFWEEYWKQERERQNQVNKILNEKRAEYEKALDEEDKRIQARYDKFMETQPFVDPVPQFSSRGERSYQFDHSLSIDELRDWGKFILDDRNDTLFRADYLLYPEIGASHTHSSMVRFLGTRLPNGRMAWKMFKEGWNYYNKDYPYDNHLAYFEKKTAYYGTKIQTQDIWNVKMAAEGQIIILEMKNGNNVVIRPNGDYLCEGRNISFPGMTRDGVFVECDGKLFCTNAPKYSSPILQGDEFQYFGRTIIVTNHDANNQPYYRLATYTGKCYDIQKHEWTRYGEHDQYSYLGQFINDGHHFIAQPKGKNYYVILAYSGGLYKGQKKYKTIEDAHAGWNQERKYIYSKGDKHPEQCAKITK